MAEELAISFDWFATACFLVGLIWIGMEIIWKYWE